MMMTLSSVEAPNKPTAEDGAAHDNNAIPAEGRVFVVPEVTKSILMERLPSEVSVVPLRAIAGIGAHAAANAVNRMAPHEVEGWHRELYLDSPPLYRDWSKAAVDAFMDYYGERPASELDGRFRLSEVSLNLGSRALGAAVVLDERLRKAIDSGDGSIDALEQVLQHCPWFEAPGGVSLEVFQKLVEGWACDFPDAMRGIEALTYTARTHHYAANRKLIMA